jgi:flavodoxin
MLNQQLGNIERDVAGTACGDIVQVSNRLKRVLLFALLGTVMVSQISCANPSGAPEASGSTSEGAGDRGVLIVYLSRTQNTKTLAEIIQQQVGGDLVSVELVTPYPEDYQATVAQVDRENESGYLPPLKSRLDSLNDYDTVFVGFPTWDMQLPPPMKSFLRTHDLSGKDVIPFNTHGGYGKGSSFETVEELCPESNVLEGVSVKGGSERDGVLLALKGERLDEVRSEVARWLRDIGILNRKAKP